MRAQATFAITGWDQAPYCEPADGPVLARERFSGALASVNGGYEGWSGVP